MQTKLHEVPRNCLRLALVAGVLCSMTISAGASEPLSANPLETPAKRGVEHSFKDLESTMASVNEAMSDLTKSLHNRPQTLTAGDFRSNIKGIQSELNRVRRDLFKTASAFSATMEKTLEQTATHLSELQKATENLKSVVMRDLATQLDSTAENLAELIPKCSAKWTSRIDRLDIDGDGALTWEEVIVDTEEGENQDASSDLSGTIVLGGSYSEQSILKSEFNLIDRNEDGKVDGAEIEAIVEEMESVRQSMSDLIKTHSELGVTDNEILQDSSKQSN